MKTANSIINKGRGSALIEVVLAMILFMMVSGVTLSTLENQRFEFSDLAIRIKQLYSDEAALQNTIAFGGSTEESQLQTVPLTPCLDQITDPSFSLSVLAPRPTALTALAGNCGGYMSPNAFSLPLATSTSPSLVTTTELSGLTTGAATATPSSILFSSLDVSGGYSYIGASSTDGYNFLVAQVASPTSITRLVPVLVSRLQTPPINAMDVAGNIAYLAVQGTSSQFQVIDIHDPTTPSVLAVKTLPNVSGSYPSAISVFYYAGRVYIGTHRTAGNEFHVFDVTTPANPRWLGSIELNHNINDIIVSGSYAFLATSGNTSDVIILAIADPAHMSIVGTLTFSGAEDTKKAFLLGSSLYLGRLKGVSAAHPEFVVVNVANPAAPNVVASSSLASPITGIRVVGLNALAATAKGLFLISGLGTKNLIPIQISNTSSTGLDEENDILYSLSNDGSNGIITITHS